MNQITYTTTNVNVLNQVRGVWLACTWRVPISITVRLPILDLSCEPESLGLPEPAVFICFIRMLIYPSVINLSVSSICDRCSKINKYTRV